MKLVSVDAGPPAGAMGEGSRNKGNPALPFSSTLITLQIDIETSLETKVKRPAVLGGKRTNCDSARLRREPKTEEEGGRRRSPTEPTRPFVIHSVMFFEHVTTVRHCSGHICLLGGD